jgi:vitamin K-dependent gamma-carboxylase
MSQLQPPVSSSSSLRQRKSSTTTTKLSDKSPSRAEPQLEVQPSTKTKHASSSSSSSSWLVSQFDEIPNDCLVAFRILWGLLIAYELLTYTFNDYSKLRKCFVHPRILFAYAYLEFVPQTLQYIRQLDTDPNGEALVQHVLIVMVWSLIAASVCVSIGLLYRLSAIVVFVGFTTLFAIDAALYLNHFYLIAVFLFVLIFVPANRSFAIDSWLIWPSYRSSSMPRYVLTLFRFEQTVVYVYAGIAKLNVDWLRAFPLQPWLSYYSHRQPEVFYFFWPLDAEPIMWFMAYAGLLFDLLAPFLLLNRHTFKFGLLLSIIFHVLNKLVLNIGIFPWVMLACLTLFFEPDWPRKWYNNATATPSITAPTLESLPAIPKPTKARKPSSPSPSPPPSPKRPTRSLTTREKVVLVLLLAFALHQTLVPLRHWVYRAQGASDVAWDECGHRWSWRMKLRDKFCSLGMAVVDRTTNTSIAVDIPSFLYGKQYNKFKTRPEMVAQFAHYLARYTVDKQYMSRLPEVYAKSYCTLNVCTAGTEQ